MSVRERRTRAIEEQQAVVLSRRADFGTIVLGQWLMLGLAIDGWAHHTQPGVESFFTPWHGVLYSGYGACAVWMIWLIARQRRAGFLGRAAIPRGEGPGVVGVLLFGFAGLGDLIWHETIGIEQNRKASLSPTHLLLFLGIVLIVSSPFRAAWASDDPAEDTPSLERFLPALLSLSGAASIVGAMLIWLWGLAYLRDGRVATALIPPEALAATQDLDLAMVLITTALLLAPLLLVLLRWRPPFGSAMILFGIIAGLLCAVTGFRQPIDVVVAVVAGLLADLGIWRYAPGPRRPAAFRALATGVPIGLWLGHFLATGLSGGIAWPPEYWIGISLLAGLVGLGLSVLLVPPTLPAHIARR
jgi:hypothetical protein